MTEQTGKTLTQLANELGVSRDKIIYRYKKLPEDHYYKENNTIYIKENGIQQIINELGDDIGEATPQAHEENSPLNDYLIEQLTKKDEQIEQLQKLIDQQQQLNAEDKKLIKELNQRLALEAPKDPQVAEAEAAEAAEIQAQLEKLAELEEKFKAVEVQLLEKEEHEKENQKKLAEKERTTEALQADKEQLKKELTELKTLQAAKQKKWFQFWK